jgi:hypothetical protein
LTQVFASLCEFAAWLAVRRIYALGHCRAAILQDRRKGAPLHGIEMFDRDRRDLGSAELLRRQNRSWPAITLCSASISTGTLKPKLAMLLAICSICLRLC